jgi:DNA-binding CsgD family transcriptional regulator/tetratricopeptide (TPR) repeat protein
MHEMPAGTLTHQTAHVPFIGRELELGFLVERLGRCAHGEGGVILLSGEPGIGKTRLLRELEGIARSGGWCVLSGRAANIEGMPPYLPFIQALEALYEREPDDVLQAVVELAPAIANLLPSLRQRSQTLPPLGVLAPEAERFRLFESVRLALAEAARSSASGGLVLCLDDLHWAENATHLLLAHLARSVAQMSVLVVGTHRPQGEGPAALQKVIADLTSERLCEQIVLTELSVEQSAELIAAMTGTVPAPTVTGGIHAHTGGNPFFVEEVVRMLSTEKRDLADPGTVASGLGLPPGVRALIEQRLSRLTSAAQQLLRSAAAVGDGATPELLRVLSGLPEDATVDGLEEATRSGMLREEGATYVFSHPLIRQVVYEGLSLARRQQLHRRTAESLEPHVALGDEATIGHQWRLGGHPERAIPFLLQAGDAALTTTAWAEAAKLWEAALACMEQAGEPAQRRARLLEGLGDLYFLGGLEAHQSVERYLQAATLYESAEDRVRGARSRSRAGRSLTFPTSGFDYPKAIRHLRLAERVLSAEPPTVELGELYAALAHAESNALYQSPALMLSNMRLLRETAEKLNNEFLRDLLRVQSYHLEGHYLGLQGHLAQGLALEERACEMATALKDSPGSANEYVLNWQTFMLGYSAQHEPAGVNEAASLQLSKWYSRLGLANSTTTCCGWQSLDLMDPLRAKAKHERVRDEWGFLNSTFLLYDLLLCGDIEELRRLTEGGTAAFARLYADGKATAQLVLAWAEGNWPEAAGILTRRAESWRKSGTIQVLTFTNRLLIRLFRTIEEPLAVEAVAEETLHLALRACAVKYEVFARVELALLLAEANRMDEARVHLSRCREIFAGGEDWRGVRGRFALAEAVAAAAEGRSEEAGVEFARAIEVFRNLSLPWDQAEAFEIWARSGRRFHRGRRRQAFVAENVASANAVYTRIGAGQPWLDRVEVLSRRLSGPGTPGERARLPDDLTVREAEVLRLVADGQSSRGIAEHLVLSVRTVERHVANIYIKTGTHGRMEAASYARSHGLVAAGGERPVPGP